MQSPFTAKSINVFHTRVDSRCLVTEVCGIGTFLLEKTLHSKLNKDRREHAVLKGLLRLRSNYFAETGSGHNCCKTKPMTDSFVACGEL